MLRAGLMKVGYAPITEISEKEVTYGEPIWFPSSEAGGRAVDCTSKGENTPLYADSATQDNIYSNDGYDISVELLGVVDNVEKDWLGKKTDGNGNSVEDASITELPRFALLVADAQHKGAKKYNVDVYLNCQVTKFPDRNSKTAEGKREIQYPKYTVSAMPRPNDNLTMYTVAVDELPIEVAVPEIAEDETQTGE